MSLLDSPETNQKKHFICWNNEIANDLLLVALQGSEALSLPFQYELRSLTKMTEAQISRWHGKLVSCRIGDGTKELPQRFLHGVVTHIRYVKHTQEDAECILTLEPSIALLKLGRMMRVWQNISVPELVRTLLSDYGISQIDLHLHGNYPKREYCVQYRESAYDFVQRLLEEEGIYFYFRHNETSHTLVLADNPSSHTAIKGNSLTWHHHGNVLTEGSIKHWASTASLIPTAVVLHGVNMPQAKSISNQQKAQSSKVHVDNVTFVDITPQGESSLISRQTQHIMTASEANMRAIDASTTAHWLYSGETFILTNHPLGDKHYRIHALSLNASNNINGNSSSFNCQLQAMDKDQPWHPPLNTMPPIIPGILTATVVGPSSEDIHTDEYGRIKIQFPWDSQSQHDENSSCWVRVMQIWAGGKFGAQFIPRVGSEVLVSFVQGHPDYPLVIGMVYNGQNKPPFPLPGEKNESGFFSRSTTFGGADEGHRFSFNDTKNKELLTIVSQKDLSLTVKNNASTIIAANRSTELTKGNDQLVLKKGDMNITLENGNCQHSITGNFINKVKNGNYNLEVENGGINTKTNQNLTFESTESIELKVGSSKITLSPTGIKISGSIINIAASETAEFTGPKLTLEGSSTAVLKGESTKVSAIGAAEFSGLTTTVTAKTVAELKGKTTIVSGELATRISGGMVNIN
ncbi:type VI secretion system tip protein VgrG [Enterobacteriaceae bacterium RIT711]|nr:type VI secretion system tip protein VgrG [Enterobacteriaceae bacterium RIT711]